MTRDEARKLLGGYATGSLTEHERKLLFESALEDQDLFDELASEQALKELIESPGVRARLQAALEPARKARVWWPWAAVAATAIVGIWLGSRRAPEQPVEMAAVQQTVEALPVVPSEPPTSPVKEAQNGPVPQRKTSTAPPAQALTLPPAPAAVAPQTEAAADAVSSPALRDSIAGAGASARAEQTQPLPVPQELAVQKQTLPSTPPQAVVVNGQPSNSNAVSRFAAPTAAPLRYEFLANGTLRLTPSVALRTLEVRVGQTALFTSEQNNASPKDVTLPAGTQQILIEYSVGTEPPTVLTVPVPR